MTQYDTVTCILEIFQLDFGEFSIGNGPFTGYECKGYYVLYGLQKKKVYWFSNVF